MPSGDSFQTRELSAPTLIKRSRPVPLIEHTLGAPAPTGAPTTVGVELLLCAALTLSVLALTAQSETSMMAAMATLKKIRLCFIYITVFRWRPFSWANIDIHADAAVTGAFSKVVTNMPIPYKGCRNLFFALFRVVTTTGFLYQRRLPVLLFI